MVKKRLSWQTLAIIILAALLLITISFGGVFAFYSARSNQVSGEIMMANLNIGLGPGDDASDQSAIIIYTEEYVVPGQVLENSPLIVRNLSTVEIILVVVYELKAERYTYDENGNVIATTPVEDQFINPVFGLGCEYLNSKDPSQNIDDPKEVYNYDWYDFVFRAEREDKYYRCMVSRKSIPKYVKGSKTNMVEVIKADKLSLHRKMGSEYVDSLLSFKFQAYAVGASTDFLIEESDTNLQKCEKMVNFVYSSQGYKFLHFKK